MSVEALERAIIGSRIRGLSVDEGKGSNAIQSGMP
jgi:hypothetical protein